jgi:hypothetical protein
MMKSTHVYPFEAHLFFSKTLHISGRSMYELLEGWLRHRNDMVVYEAARAICNLKNVTPRELVPAVSGISLSYTQI